MIILNSFLWGRLAAEPFRAFPEHKGATASAARLGRCDDHGNGFINS
ncbi:hypothetical protein [Oceanicella sp. SM1341]|nr:hypothetical protein [Oceanicella sp. SM1341]